MSKRERRKSLRGSSSSMKAKGGGYPHEGGSAHRRRWWRGSVKARNHRGMAGAALYDPEEAPCMKNWMGSDGGGRISRRGSSRRKWLWRWLLCASVQTRRSGGGMERVNATRRERERVHECLVQVNGRRGVEKGSAARGRRT